MKNNLFDPYLGYNIPLPVFMFLLTTAKSSVSLSMPGFAYGKMYKCGHI
jgi:hypothetical protein